MYEHRTKLLLTAYNRLLITSCSLFAEPTAGQNCCVQFTIVFAVKVKLKASHTRHRALGPELIPVYRQSARRWP